MGPYPPRILEFRERLIRELPRAPMNRASLAQVQAMPTGRLILAYLTWRMRFVPARPRRVTVWSGGVTHKAFQRALPEISGLLEDVLAGVDLTPRLSKTVETKGIVLPGAKLDDKGRDLDAVLVQLGLHHLHVGTVSPANPQGRSGKLVFAEILEHEFRIVALAPHTAFKAGSPEHLALTQTALAYSARSLGPGEGQLLNPVMCSGHSLVTTVFSDFCGNLMEIEDPALDDPAKVDLLYAILAESLPEAAVPRPKKPSMIWYFHDLQFGILDRKTGTFFSRLPFYAR